MRLFGPVFRCNLVRLARQPRHFVIRIIYASFLLALVMAMRGAYQAYTNVGSPALTANLMASFSEQFFLLLLGQQALMVLVLTPGCVATALSEEKQSRQLELLLTTDVGVGEIVLGKLLARLGQILLLVLASLPVLSLMQLFGGVEPSLIWTGYAGTLLLVLSLGSVSILCSLYAVSTPGAVLTSYLVPAAFILLGWLLPQLHTVVALMDGNIVFHKAVDQLIRLHGTCDPFAVMKELRQHVQTVGRLSHKPWELLDAFARVHGIVIFICLGWTMLRLRRVYLRHVAQEQLPPRRPRSRRRWSWPRLSERPVWWKECHFHPRSPLLWLTRLVSGIVMLAVVSVGVGFVGLVFASGFQPAPQQELNNFLRIVGPVLLGIALLQIGVGAASSLHAERQQLTWDSLVMSLIPVRGILAGKWWGSIYATRHLLVVLGLLLVLGVISGALHPVMAVLMAGVVMMSCTLTATLGMHFAVKSATHFRAVLGTLVAVLILNVVVPALAPLAWAYSLEGTYYYPAPPDQQVERDLRRRRRGSSPPPTECQHRETWVAALLKSSSPLNAWQMLALTFIEVEQGGALLRQRYEWEEERALENHRRRPYALRYPLVHLPWKSFPERVIALTLMASLWLLADWWLWRRTVRRLMLQLERVDEYPIRYWSWPPAE